MMNTSIDTNRLDKLRATRNRTPDQQEEFERLNALAFFGCELPAEYDPPTYVVYLEPANLDGSGDTIAQLANVRAAVAKVDAEGRVWLQGVLYDLVPRPEDAPRLATGLSEQARQYLARGM